MDSLSFVLFFPPMECHHHQVSNAVIRITKAAQKKTNKQANKKASKQASKSSLTSVSNVRDVARNRVPDDQVRMYRTYCVLFG